MPKCKAEIAFIVYSEYHIKVLHPFWEEIKTWFYIEETKTKTVYWISCVCDLKTTFFSDNKNHKLKNIMSFFSPFVTGREWVFDFQSVSLSFIQ